MNISSRNGLVELTKCKECISIHSFAPFAKCQFKQHNFKQRASGHNTRYVLVCTPFITGLAQPRAAPHTSLAFRVCLAEALRIIAQCLQRQHDVFLTVVEPEAEADGLAAAVNHNAAGLQPGDGGRCSLRAVLYEDLPQGRQNQTEESSSNEPSSSPSVISKGACLD